MHAKSYAILGQASVVHRGIGVKAAAAAVDACVQHARAQKDSDAHTHDVAGSSLAAKQVSSSSLTAQQLEALPRMSCKASILAKLALRSCLLAQRETLDMRRLMVSLSRALSLSLSRVLARARAHARSLCVCVCVRARERALLGTAPTGPQVRAPPVHT